MLFKYKNLNECFSGKILFAEYLRVYSSSFDWFVWQQIALVLLLNKSNSKVIKNEKNILKFIYVCDIAENFVGAKEVLNLKEKE